MISEALNGRFEGGCLCSLVSVSVLVAGDLPNHDEKPLCEQLIHFA